jgi:hypothetical protein
LFDENQLVASLRNILEDLQNSDHNLEQQKINNNNNQISNLKFENQIKKLNKNLFEEKQKVIELTNKLENTVYEKNCKISFYENNESILKANINEIHDNYSQKIISIHSEYENDNIELNNK